MMKPKTDIFQERFVMTPHRLTESVLALIISGNLSFRFAEDPMFRKLLKTAFPTIDLPTREGVTNRLTQAVSDTKTALRETFQALDSKVSLVADGWNSRGNRDFIGTHPIVMGCLCFLVSWGHLPLHFRSILIATANVDDHVVGDNQALNARYISIFMNLC